MKNCDQKIFGDDSVFREHVVLMDNFTDST